MNSFLLTILAITALVFLQSSPVSCDASLSTTLNPFNFYDYFDGTWEIQKISQDPRKLSILPSEQLGKYTFYKVNDSFSLMGSYYENNTETGEISGQKEIFIEFSENSIGIFKMGEDFDHQRELFQFSFVQSGLHGIPMSIGKWEIPTSEEKKEYFYQFLCVSPTVFTITINNNQDSSSTLYIGRKSVPIQAKTFWQQYSSMIMLGGFFIFNLYIKSKTANMGKSSVATASTGKPAAVTGGKKKE